MCIIFMKEGNLFLTYPSFLFASNIGPHQEIASDLVQVYLTGMKGGEIQYAVGALYVSVGYSFFGGSHLNLLSETATDSLGFVAKHNYETLGDAGEMLLSIYKCCPRYVSHKSPSLPI